MIEHVGYIIREPLMSHDQRAIALLADGRDGRSRDLGDKCRIASGTDAMDQDLLITPLAVSDDLDWSVGQVLAIRVFEVRS